MFFPRHLLVFLNVCTLQVLATGTKLVPPGSLPGSEKLDGVAYIEKHAEQIEKSQKIVIIGGGAVGIQMATDVKQLFPEKSVTIVHSRKNVMNRFHSKLHDIIEERAKELGIHLKLGSRVKIPEEGFPTDGREFKVELQDGSSVEADFAVSAFFFFLGVLSVILLQIVEKSIYSRKRLGALF